VTTETATGSLPALNDGEFGLFQRLIQREAGIHLADVKKPLLVSRLSRRLRELGLDSFGAYYRRVEEDAEERVRMLDRVTTNKTQFFRDPTQFEFVEKIVLPEWAASTPPRRRVRAWSAGCSTGEEAYTLGAVLFSHAPAEAGWTIDILGTDISTRVLEHARRAVWPLERSAEIPPQYLNPHFLKGYGAQEGNMTAGAALRKVTRFERGNLADEREWPSGTFDLIFCRNVLIYFTPVTKARVVEGLLGRLAPGGYLFLGHAESLNVMEHRIRSVGPTVYRRP